MSLDSDLWRNVVKVINGYENSEIELDQASADKLHQLKCHILLNGKKLGLLDPITTEIKISDIE